MCILKVIGQKLYSLSCPQGKVWWTHTPIHSPNHPQTAALLYPHPTLLRGDNKQKPLHYGLFTWCSIPFTALLYTCTSTHQKLIKVITMQQYYASRHKSQNIRSMHTFPRAICLCATASSCLDWLSISYNGANVAMFVSLYFPFPRCTWIPILYTLYESSLEVNQHVIREQDVFLTLLF